MTDKQLIMYARSYGCPFVSTARQVLQAYHVPYQEIFIDRNEAERQKVVAWTGFESVPTLVIAHIGTTDPIEEPVPLPPGHSPRGIDRGYMLTEPSGAELKQWLLKHGLLQRLQAE